MFQKIKNYINSKNDTKEQQTTTSFIKKEYTKEQQTTTSFIKKEYTKEQQKTISIIETQYNIKWNNQKDLDKLTLLGECKTNCVNLKN